MQLRTAGNHDCSRRSFLLGCSLAAPLLIGRCEAEQIHNIRFKLVKEIRDAFFRAVSSDSRRLCLCFTSKPVGTFTIRGSADRKRVSKDAPSAGLLKVIEIGSWKEIYSASIDGNLGGFEFFPDGETLFGRVSIVALPTVVEERILIDLRTSSSEKRQEKFDPNGLVSLQPLGDHTLIGVRGGIGLGRHELVHVQWPELQQTRVVAVDGQVGAFALTADRKLLIHVVDQWLVCRRVEDFGVLWKRQIDPEIDLKARWHNIPTGPAVASAAYCISADSSRVALAPGQAGPSSDKPERYYIEILDGKDGRPLTRWPMKSYDRIELSPDGKLLAIGEAVADKGYLDPTVHVHEIPSGREIATVVHDHLPPSRHQVLNASLSAGIQFTPDGKYLITSANNRVKIWEIS